MKQDWAEENLEAMLKAAGLTKRPSYLPWEVCLLLRITRRTFQRLSAAYTPDPATGKPVNPQAIDTFTLNAHRRVSHKEMADYLRRNRTFERLYGG